MEQSVPFAIVFGVVLVLVLVLFGTMITISYTHNSAIAQATALYRERLNSRISVTSTDVALVTSGSGKCATLYVEVNARVANRGDVSIDRYADMDVWLDYISAAGQPTRLRPVYVSAYPDANQWTSATITPNALHSGVWDPGDALTVVARPYPFPLGRSLGTVAVSTPLGIVDSDYVDFAYDEARSNDCRYLHNNPSPPTGNTNRQVVLPMDATAPSAATLYNYDVDVDGNPGRTIAKGGTGAGETVAGKYQAWRSGPLAAPLTISGTVSADLWAAIQAYSLAKEGIVNVFFRDYDGASYAEIGSVTFYSADWQGGVSNFVRKVALVPGFDYTIPAGNQLEVKLTVGAIAASEMWFAYDTAARQSLVNLSYAPPTYATLLYLHNNPTPPVGDTAAQAVLPMDGTTPTATTLYNYDTNYDANAGRVLQKTPSGLGEGNVAKRQVWRSGALASDLAIVGDVTVDLWAATLGFAQGQVGVVTVYLRDYNGSTHTEIANGSVYAADWQAGSGTWVSRSVQVPEVNYTVPAGDELEVFMVVELKSTANMWFAYDTQSYPAVLKIP